MQELKNFSLSERSLLGTLVQRLRRGEEPKLKIDEAKRKLGDLYESAISSLVEKGYVKIEGKHVELTLAASLAFRKRKPARAAVIHISKEKVEVYPRSVALKKKLEQKGEKAYYGYVLRGAKTPSPKRQPPITAQQALNLLKEGKTRYAAIKAYSLALKLGEKDLIEEARKILKNPTPQKIAKILLKIVAHLNKGGI